MSCLRLKQAALGWVAGALVGAGCGGGASEEQAAEAEAPVYLEIESDGGDLVAYFPADLWVGRLPGALMATDMEGKLRLYIERREAATLPALLGTLKDAYLGLGWGIEGEAHFERAVSFRSHIGSPTQETLRETWLFESGPAFVLCEGLAAPGHHGRLDDLREICQQVFVRGEPANLIEGAEEG